MKNHSICFWASGGFIQGNSIISEKKWVTDCLIPLTSDTTPSCYQACSKKLAVTLETVVNVSGALLPLGKGRGVSDLYQVTQQARGHARNRICASHLPVHGPCSTPYGYGSAPHLDKEAEVHKRYSEKKEENSPFMFNQAQTKVRKWGNVIHFCKMKDHCICTHFLSVAQKGLFSQSFFMPGLTQCYLEGTKIRADSYSWPREKEIFPFSL